MKLDVILVAYAVAATAVVYLLGGGVAHREFARIDLAAIRLRNHFTPLATFFTRSGYVPSLLVVYVAAVGVSLYAGTGTRFLAALGVTQLLAQLAVERIKHRFRRARPDDWLVHHELGFSFPSGHSASAVVFYGGLILGTWSVQMPRDIHVALTLAFAVFVVGIPWSRMALAAHYATDVMGGALFGTALLAAMTVILRHLPAAHPLVVQ